MNEWRRSWMRGDAWPPRATQLRLARNFSNVLWTVRLDQWFADDPRRRTQQRLAAGICASGPQRNGPSAAAVVGCSGTRRDLRNFVSRTVRSSKSPVHILYGLDGAPPKSAARGCQQAEKGAVGQRTETAGRQQIVRRVQKRPDLLLRYKYAERVGDGRGRRTSGHDDSGRIKLRAVLGEWTQNFSRRAASVASPLRRPAPSGLPTRRSTDRMAALVGEAAKASNCSPAIPRAKPIGVVAPRYSSTSETMVGARFMTDLPAKAWPPPVNVWQVHFAVNGRRVQAAMAQNVGNLLQSCAATPHSYRRRATQNVRSGEAVRPIRSGP